MNTLKWRFDTFRKLQVINGKWQKPKTNKTALAEEIDEMIETLKHVDTGLTKSEVASLITRLQAVSDLFNKEYIPDHERLIRIALQGSMHILKPA